MTKYFYKMSGTDAAGQSWETSGLVDRPPGSFTEAVSAAMFESFDKLTKGEAVFGQPGVGCQGPYTINKLVVTRKQS